MAIVEMKQLTLIGMQRDKQPLVEKLHQLGVVQVDAPESLPAEEEETFNILKQDQGRPVAELDNRLSVLGRALDFTAPYDTRKKGLLPANTLISEKRYREYLDNEQEAMEMAERCRQKEERLAQLRGEQAQKQSLIDSLSFWEGLDIPLAEVGSHPDFMVELGTIPTREAEGFLSSLPELAWGEVVNTDARTTGYVLIYHADAAGQLEEVLRQWPWTRVTLGNLEATAAEHIKESGNALEGIEKERAEILAEAARLATRREPMETLYDHLRQQKERYEVVSNFMVDDTVFMFKGWLPAKEEERVKSALLEVSENIYFETSSPEEGEPFPVALQNHTLAEPYEMVTEMYGIPDPGNLDPTPFMAPFFWIFFGMMLSDAGYGIIMTVLGFAALHFLKPKGTAKQLISIIAYGGISTFIWGVVFGSWFGDLLGLAPAWFNPLEDPMMMLIFVFACGLVHLFFGLGIAAYMNIKKGKPLDAFFDQMLWVLLISGLLLMALPAAADAGKYLAIASVAGLVLTQGRHQKNGALKFLSGLGSLYNVTSWLSDVLSYARIFALGLATAVIAMVFNILAKMGGDGIVGMIVLVVVLLIGHVFNLLLSGLGAYVHTSRLQYIEFFGKFYQSGGKAFTPFRFRPKYIEITKEEDMV